ncbi:DNA polymerase subunit Cdc27 [Amylostereum chailletii]|nr:DNA polymerase subunit Cdc27 [Amylostereum chailletii]
MDTTERAMDYLSKELVVDRNIVTFRSLSRALGIHVNDAKVELARYHTAFKDTPDAAHATYIITGYPKRSEQGRNDMEVDDVGDEYDDEDVEETKIALVSEAALADEKEEYYKVYSCYIHTLSPSPIREPDLICEPNQQIRGTEKQNGRDFALIVGRITGPHVKLRSKKSKALASTSTGASSSKAKSRFPPLKKPGLAKPAKPDSGGKDQVKDKERPKDTEKDKGKEKGKEAEKAKEDKQTLKARPSGKLDFSKASTKPKPAPVPKAEPKAKPPPPPQKEEEEESEESQPKPKVQEPKAKFGPPKRRPSKRAPSDEEDKLLKVEPKRGMKRKSAILFSDSEDDASSPASATTPPSSNPASRGTSIGATAAVTRGRAKRGVIFSSDEDEDLAPKPQPKEEEIPAVDDDAMAVDEDFEPAVKAKPKRKPKKEIPVGKNGLKKKRVVKQRTTFDEKGYMVTEDFSDYESVDEEEPEPVKEKAAGRKKAPPKEGTSKGLRPSEPKAKKVGGQQSLKNFFAK